MGLYRKLLRRFRAAGFWQTLNYLLFTVILERLGVHFTVVFSHSSNDVSAPSQSNFEYQVVQSLEEMSADVRAALLDYGDEAMLEDFAKSFALGHYCALGFIDGQFGCICWFRSQVSKLFPGEQVFLIWRCFTLPAARGKKLYPLTLQACIAYLRGPLASEQRIKIECSPFNGASIKGIRQVGFQPIARKVEIGRWKHTYGRARRADH